MCGINGILAYRPGAAPVDRDELVKVRDSMMSRGPDSGGLWISDDRRVGFGHRRLAIIDLSADGNQPMTSTDGRLTITYNGEIYNYKELRADLQSRGVQFRTKSDTEVILALYAEHGPEAFSRLRGMFTFGLWDAPEQQLILG